MFGKSKKELQREIDRLKKENTDLEIARELSAMKEYSLGAAVRTILYNPFKVPELTTLTQADGSCKVTLVLDMSPEDVFKLEEYFNIQRKHIQFDERK